MTTATTRKPSAAATRKAEAEAAAKRVTDAAALRKANADQARAATAAKPTDAAAAANATVLNGTAADTRPRTARAATRKPNTTPAGLAAAKPAPKPAAKTARKPARQTEDNHASTPKTDKRAANQELARRLVNAVAAEFAKDGTEAQQKVANWLKFMPTGDPSGKTDGAGGNRYWPKGFTRPDTADWAI